MTTVTDPRPLDLLLYDAGPLPGRPDGYAAHVAVHLAADRILHLCKEAARPAVWTPADFAARPRYTSPPRRQARPGRIGGNDEGPVRVSAAGAFVCSGVSDGTRTRIFTKL
ncbi:hypothetical protein ACU686_05170 [Yinghuangia aomiensis]